MGEGHDCQREWGDLLMAELLTTDTELQTVANAIRAKTGGSAALGYPNGFAAAIAGIGSDCTATAADIRSGKTAYAGNSKVTGSMTEKAAATYNPSADDQTIASGQYLAGAQTIRKVMTSNIDAANIKTGVTVKVGDAEDDDRVASVTGTYTADANATAAQILSGKTAYVNGTKISGTIPSKAAATYNTSKNADQTIAAGQYLSGAQTIRKVTTTNLTAANIKRGVTVKVGDAGDADRVASVEGTCQPVNTWISQSDGCFVPFMWRANAVGNVPGYYYTDGDDSGSAAQKSKGFHATTYVDPRTFRVPCPVKMTYYEADNSSTQKTVTFQPGSTYSITRDNGLKHLLTGPSINTYVWKVVKWELV